MLYRAEALNFKKKKKKKKADGIRAIDWSELFRVLWAAKPFHSIHFHFSCLLTYLPIDASSNCFSAFDTFFYYCPIIVLLSSPTIVLLLSSHCPPIVSLMACTLLSYAPYCAPSSTQVLSQFTTATSISLPLCCNRTPLERSSSLKPLHLSTQSASISINHQSSQWLRQRNRLA